jgi:DNA-binding transcriptional ArsR family regulator
METDVSQVARLFADPTRAALLVYLLDGRPRPAGELAAAAGVSAQVASNQLARLREGGLLLREAQGRQRRYRLRSVEVARALEALATLQPTPQARRPAPAVPADLRFARSCYDHLAGVLGVSVCEALSRTGFLLQGAKGFRAGAAGEAWLQSLGIEVAQLRAGRRPLARGCLDWTERRPHLAGALGAALLARWLKLEWLVRVHKSRALRLTLKGRRALEKELGLRLPSPSV